MATIRILLATYQRAHLLPRAVESLRRQTFDDWTCEVHNDDPRDPLPATIVAAANDRRLRCIQHAQNLGVTGTVNQLFAPAPEPFAALLEDDNWWEPRLLETLLAVLHQQPDVDVVWSNLRLWREENDGSWTDLRQTVWSVPPQPGVRSFDWPAPRHVLGHLHSNGAMLVRCRAPAEHILPPSAAPGASEAIRERSFRFPLMLVEEPLANFAVTRTTARAWEQRPFFRQQVLLAATFFKHVAPPRDFAAEVFGAGRATPGRTTHVLVSGALLTRSGRRWLRCLRSGDWAWFWAWTARHPGDLVRGLASRRRMPDIWRYLDRHTARLALQRSSTAAMLPQ